MAHRIKAIPVVLVAFAASMGTAVAPASPSPETASTGLARSEKDPNSHALAVEERLQSRVHRGFTGRWRSLASEVTRAIVSESRRNGLDPMMVAAVIESESSFRPSVRGSQGEIGLMQLKPRTARWVRKRMRMKPGKLADPVENIRVGAAYLGYLKRRFGFDARRYLSAYNSGETAIARTPLARTPRIYYAKVHRNYLKLASRAR